MPRQMLDLRAGDGRTLFRMGVESEAGKADANGPAAAPTISEQPPRRLGQDPTRPIGPGNPPQPERGPRTRGPSPAKLRKARLIQERAERLQKAQQVFDLVIGGTTLQRTADMLGISKSAAHRLYHEGLNHQDVGTGDQFRERQLARLERMLHALWPKVVKGDPIATREARHVTDQMNRLVGIYPALGIDLTATVTTRSEGMNRVAAALDALRQQQLRQGGLLAEEQAVDELPALTTGSSAA